MPVRKEGEDMYVGREEGRQGRKGGRGQGGKGRNVF